MRYAILLALALGACVTTRSPAQPVPPRGINAKATLTITPPCKK